MKKGLMYMLAGVGACVVYSQMKNGNVQKVCDKLMKKTEHDINDMMKEKIDDL